MRESDLYWWEKLVRKCSSPDAHRLRISKKTCDAILGINEGIKRLRNENKKLRKRNAELEQVKEHYPK